MTTPSLTRREFHRLAASGVAAGLAGVVWPSAHAATPVDVPWQSPDPHLSGNFLPVERETDASDLRVLAGQIPRDLRGVYMRNGPNPEFKPLFFAYPMDGDGMIHAVYLEDGRARYRNRFVRTAGLALEERAGRAVYGSFTHPVAIDPTLLGPNDSHSPIKDGAFINVIRHGERVLALHEASPCYEMSLDLETLGLWTADTPTPVDLGAHNRRHPTTGELHGLSYSVQHPVVTLHRFRPAGGLIDSSTVTLPMPTMIHDFILTERYIVLIAGPAVFDMQAAQSGKPALQWRPDLGTRIALIPLDGSKTLWVEGDPFFAYHFANGFERGGQIIVDYVHHERFSFQAGAAPTLRRMTIDPVRARFTLAPPFLPDATEFPRINDRHQALASRYVYSPIRTASLTLDNPPSAVFNTVVKTDTETGRTTRHDLGNQIAGEPAFVPRPGARREDDGYVVTFAHDPARQRSTFVLLDAARLDDEPVAVIEMPQRVPQGLHGNWMPYS